VNRMDPSDPLNETLLGTVKNSAVTGSNSYPQHAKKLEDKTIADIHSKDANVLDKVGKQLESVKDKTIVGMEVLADKSVKGLETVVDKTTQGIGKIKDSTVKIAEVTKDKTCDLISKVKDKTGEGVSHLRDITGHASERLLEVENTTGYNAQRFKELSRQDKEGAVEYRGTSVKE